MEPSELLAAERAALVRRCLELRERDEVALAEAVRRLRAVDDAVVRVEGGIYGRCTGCGTRIPEAHLLAEPTTERCGGCRPT